MKIYLRKVQGGFVPDDDESAEWLQKVKLGGVISAEVARPRNYKFLKKTMVLFKVCFDHFAEHLDTGLEYRGMKVEPSFELFRKQLTILAGHYTASYDIRGNVRLEAKSLSFANCTEEEAERIYSDVINAALKQVYRKKISEQQLRAIVDDILAFA